MSMLVHMGQAPRKPANAFSQAIHAEIRAIMARRHMTQDDLEAASGVKQPMISKIIFMNRASLDTNQLDAICKALDVPVLSVLQAAERALAQEEETEVLRAAKEDEPDVDESDYL